MALVLVYDSGMAQSNWRDIKKYRYLLLASAVIVAALLALLFMQYRSVRQAQEYTRKTVKANLELHLFEVSAEAKRGILDHATHVIHSVRQQNVRERDIPGIERAFTRSARRYPEIADFYVVFFDKGAQNETWQAWKFVRPDPRDPRVLRYKDTPVGRLVNDPAASESLRRAWLSIEPEAQTALYTAFDQQDESANPRQYFFHTVFELDRMKRDKPLENVGLLAFSAEPDKFPAPGYFPQLVAKHQKLDKEVDGLTGRVAYTVTLQNGNDNRILTTSGNDSAPALTRRFAVADKLFPNLVFGIAAPRLEARAHEYTQASLSLGLLAVLVALAGLWLTWRAIRREMQIAQVKADFLANISHELKTPLTAIRAFGDLLHSGRASKPERIREYGGLIKTESDRLTALINNILEMSRLERGARKFRLAGGDLRATVADTVEFFRHDPATPAFDIQLKLPARPATTCFDADAIRQALLNLLANAVKYSGQPRIEVSLEIEANTAILAVRDFGKGVPEDEQRSIFLPFHRAASENQTGGTGLGLAIVREIAKGHGGEVFVTSQPGAGATFSLHLPALAYEAQEGAETKENGTYFGYRGRAERSYRVAR